MRFNLLCFLIVVLSFFSQLYCYALPNDVSGALGTMWTNFKNTVRRPVTLKRRGRRARRTRGPLTSVPQPRTTTTMPVRETTSTATSPGLKIELPVFPNPEWRDLYHWSNLQRPWFALEIFKEFQTRRFINNEASRRIPHLDKPVNKNLLNSKLVYKSESNLYH